MTYATYPTIKYSYNLVRKPMGKTLVQTPVNWKTELRAPMWDSIRNVITLNYQALSDYETPKEYEVIYGFFCSKLLSGEPFYLDPRNNDPAFGIIDGTIGTGDAVEDTFQLIKNWGTAYAEPCKYITTAPNIYLDDVLKATPGDYIINGDGEIVFTAPPGNGVAITADFSYAYLVRFLEDSLEIENFTYKLWKLDRVDLIEVGS